MGSFLSIIIICAISSISSSTSIQLFSEEVIIHRLGEGFYHHKYIPSNTFTAVDKRVLNRIKYYPRSLDFMMIKSLP